MVAEWENLIIFGTQINADFQDFKIKTYLKLILERFFCVHLRKSASKINEGGKSK